MESSNEQHPSSAKPSGLPMLLWIWGIPAICGTAFLAARIVWEETFLTWDNGLQMVGYSLVHNASGALLILFPVLLAPWILVAAAMIIVRLVKKRLISNQVWATLVLACLVLGALILPYGFWQQVFAAKLAASPEPGEFLTFAAAKGDLGTIKALISHGVPVDATDNGGQTALHVAAYRGQMTVLKYLVSRGANLNAIDSSGNSPLEEAWAGQHDDAYDYLEGLGARKIHGDYEQQRKANEAAVRKELEQIEKERKANQK